MAVATASALALVAQSVPVRVARLSSSRSPYSSSSAYPTLSNASAGPSVADATWTPEMVWNTNFVDVYSANLAWLSVEKCVFFFFSFAPRVCFCAFFGEDFFECFRVGVRSGEWRVGAVRGGVENGVRG
jgi:hypothetical protein